MRLLIQRVSSAKVYIAGKTHSAIEKGLLVFVGISKTDSEVMIPKLAKKLTQLRIFEDDNGKMNLSLQEIDGEILLVSQFTLYADCRRGRRPDFIDAAPPQQADNLYNVLIQELSKTQLKIKTGQFGEFMQISLVNEGPVTIMLDSDLL